jgi:hypothetical protein
VRKPKLRSWAVTHVRWRTSVVDEPGPPRPLRRAHRFRARRSVPGDLTTKVGLADRRGQVVNSGSVPARHRGARTPQREPPETSAGSHCGTPRRRRRLNATGAAGRDGPSRAVRRSSPPPHPSRPRPRLPTRDAGTRTPADVTRLMSAHMHHPADLGRRDPRAVLLDQPLPDPSRSARCLGGASRVGLQQESISASCAPAFGGRRHTAELDER